MTPYKVLVLDPVSQEGIEALRQHKDFIVSRQIDLSESQIIDIVGDFEALIVRSQTTITERILQHLYDWHGSIHHLLTLCKLLEYRVP